MRRRPIVLALLVSGAAIASCGPKLDSSGSNPNHLESLEYLYANDPALSYDVISDAMVLAYDDEAGAFDADTTTGTLAPKANPSRAGISTSRDHGKSWTRVGPIAATGAGCGAPPCVAAIAGAATLEPMEQAGRFVWVGQALTDASLPVPDALVTSNSKDGKTWPPARIAEWTPGITPGEPSVARAGNASVVAFADREQGNLLLLVDDRVPPSFDAPPYLLPITRDEPGIPKVHPIVRLYTGMLGFVAYVLRRGEQATTFDLRIAMISRHVTPGLGLSPWEGLVVFRLDNISFDASRPGALGRSWRDEFPIGLALGKGPHIYAVYRQRSAHTGLSEVLLVDCDSSGKTSCAVLGDGSNSTDWNVTAVNDYFSQPPFDGGKYRPSVGADPFSGAVAFTWLQETSPGSATLTLVGMESTDPHGLILSTPADLTTAGGGQPWEPCPTAGTAGGGAHSYGSHDSTVVLPFGAADTSATVVSAYAQSSAGCKDLGQVTYDQHVQVTPW